MKDSNLHQVPKDILDSQSSIYSSCVECGWEGKVTDTNMDTYYDQFSDTNNSFPVCPKCGGTIRIDQQ